MDAAFTPRSPAAADSMDEYDLDDNASTSSSPERASEAKLEGEKGGAAECVRRGAPARARAWQQPTHAVTTRAQARRRGG